MPQIDLSYIGAGLLMFVAVVTILTAIVARRSRKRPDTAQDVAAPSAPRPVADPALEESLEAKRRLQTIPRQCSGCQHYDFEEGQAAMNEYPMFKAACAVVPPSQMGAIVEYDKDGEKLPRKGSGVPQKARWDRDFGACMKPNGDPTVVYKGDVCEDYAQRTDEQLAADAQLQERFIQIDIARGRVV